MPGSGANLANLILSSAQIQSNLRTQGAMFERSLFETRSAARDQAIQQMLAEKAQKKADRKARKKKNATLGIAAAVTVLTAGAGSVLFGAAAGAGGLAIGTAGEAAATGFLAGTGTGILGTTGAVTMGAMQAAVIPSVAATFTQGALQGLGMGFGLSGLSGG